MQKWKKKWTQKIKIQPFHLFSSFGFLILIANVSTKTFQPLKWMPSIIQLKICEVFIHWFLQLHAMNHEIQKKIIVKLDISENKPHGSQTLVVAKERILDIVGWSNNMLMSMIKGDGLKIGSSTFEDMNFWVHDISWGWTNQRNSTPKTKSKIK